MNLPYYITRTVCGHKSYLDNEWQWTMDVDRACQWLVEGAAIEEAQKRFPMATIGSEQVPVWRVRDFGFESQREGYK